MFKNILTLILFCCFQLNLKAQIPSYINDNEVYQDYIQAVQFGVGDLTLSLPVIDLESQGKLNLEFDDTEGGYKPFLYRIVHCDKDWKNSQLEEIEYIYGFNDEEIEEFSYSTNAYSEYTHYQLSLPNDDLEWTISGNYILYIYDDEIGVPILSRRFVVAENEVSIDIGVIQPKSVAKRKSHHELIVKVNYGGFVINSPNQEIFLYIMQNGNWNSAKSNIKHTYDRGDILFYDQFDYITFPALKGYRQFDTRTLKSRSEFVYAIDQNDYETNVLLDLGKRHYVYFRNDPDANGGFVLSNNDFLDADVSSEYVNVIFTLECDSLPHDVYITGALSGYRPSDKFKMEYDSERQIYHKMVSLKQGYYDYMYAMLTPEGLLDISYVEGDWFETENDYLAIIYYRSIAGEYDRVLGVRNINSYPR